MVLPKVTGCSGRDAVAHVRLTCVRRCARSLEIASILLSGAAGEVFVNEPVGFDERKGPLRL